MGTIKGRDLHKKYRVPGLKTVKELREEGQKKISKTLRYKEDHKVRHKLKLETQTLIEDGERD